MSRGNVVPVPMLIHYSRGSLTSPPCTEGIRFYVARQIIFVGVEQMRAILRVSHYSARAEQEVWQHEINA